MHEEIYECGQKYGIINFLAGVGYSDSIEYNVTFKTPLLLKCIDTDIDINTQKKNINALLKF